MNEDEYKIKVSEFIIQNKEFVFNNFNDSNDFGTSQNAPTSSGINNTTTLNHNNINNNTSFTVQQHIPVTATTNTFSSLLTQNNVPTNTIPNNINSTSLHTHTNTINSFLNNSMMGPPSMNHQHHQALGSPSKNNHHHLNNNSNWTMNNSSIGGHSNNFHPTQPNTNINYSQPPETISNNAVWNGMQSNSSLLTNNSFNINISNMSNGMTHTSHVSEHSSDIMNDIVFTSSPQQQTPVFQQGLSSPPQPTISSFRRPQLLKANSHSSIVSFSNCPNTESSHFQTGTLSSCSSSSSLSDLVSTMANIDLDNDSNNSSGMLRRTTNMGSFSRPPLKKCSSLTAVAQQPLQHKGIQKKKEQVLSVSTVQSLVSSSLSSSPQQQEMHMPSPVSQATTPFSPMSRPMFVKSKSHGQISIQLPNQNKLPSLSQVFGEKFFEETRPSNGNQLQQ